MRHRIFRNMVSDIASASRLAKIVLIIPFIVLLVDAEIFTYSWTHHERPIFIASGFVLALSIIEIIVVLSEIHQHYSITKEKEKILDLLRNIALNMEEPTVKKIVASFLEKYPNNYKVNDVYCTACDLMCEYELRKN